MHELIRALLAERVTTLRAARLVEADLIESGAKHAKVDLSRLREILRLVRMVIGPYSEEEKAEAKAELDELAALTGAPPAEGESMVERAARAAIMKARAGGELQGEGPTGDATAVQPAIDAIPAAPTEPAVPAAPAPVAPAAPAAPAPAPAPEPKSATATKAKDAIEKATGRTVSVKISEADLSHDQISTKLSDALNGGSKSKGAVSSPSDLWPREVYDDYLIYRDGDKTYRRDYAIDAKGKVTLGDKTEVVETWKPISEAVEIGDSCLIEAVEPTGKIIDVLAIKTGLSANGTRYRAPVLSEAVNSGLFEGRPSYAPEGGDHFPGDTRRGVRALVGWWDNARYGTHTLPSGKAVEGVAAHYHPIDHGLREKLVEAINGGNPGLIGFSIYGDGPMTNVREGGRMIRDVGKIDVIDSIDPVMHPAAGGQALRLVASTESPMLCSKCGQPQVEGHLCQSAPDVTKLVEAEVQKVLGPIKQRAIVEAALAEFPKLPAKARERVMHLAEARTDLTPESAKALIEAEAEYIASITAPKVIGAGPVIEAGQDQRSKLVESISDVLDGKTASIRKVYMDLTGDYGMTGKHQESGRIVESRLVESAIISTTFPLLTQEAMHKRLLAEYRLPGLDNWRKIVSGVTSANDFRAQKFVLQGGYGDLSTVAEAGPYLTIAEPGEDDIDFPAVHKVGGLEDLTLEAIANDDVRIFRRIPTSLARAAKRTLYKGVWSVLTTNADFEDTASAALFHTDKGNLGTSALSASSLVAARLAMMRQAQVTSAERLGIAPKYLIIPADLEETAYVLLNTTKVVGSAENDVSFIANFGLQVIRVDHWTDANDWYLCADPTQWDTLEVAFFQGREEPELFLQDEPTNGDNFLYDRLTYKIRHIWAVGVVDYRGLYRNTVT